MSNGIYDDGFNFTATGSVVSEVATANITGATDIFPHIVRAVFPTVTLGTIVQSPSPLSVANFGATLDTQNVTFTVRHVGVPGCGHFVKRRCPSVLYKRVSCPQSCL
jgi:hypothetical protein